MTYLLSALAFGLFFYYDWCTVRRPGSPVLRWGFPAAGGLVGLATVLTAVRCGVAISSVFGRLVWGAGSVLCFSFLVKALFFSLPAGTYKDPAKHRAAYDGGLYALCRHPGFLAFALLYICLGMLFGQGSWGCFLLLCLLNFCYIVLQDRWTFPHLFDDYNDYRRRVPFLVPNDSSIKRWLCHVGKETEP